MVLYRDGTVRHDVHLHGYYSVCSLKDRLLGKARTMPNDGREAEASQPVQEAEPVTLTVNSGEDAESIRTFWRCPQCNAQLHVDLILLGGAEAHSVWCENCNRPMDAPQKPIETDFASVAAEYSSWTESSTGGA